MRTRLRWISVGLLSAALLACHTPKVKEAGRQKSAAKIAEQQQAAKAAVVLLQGGRFDEATKEAELVLQADDQNPQARVVRAVAGYIDFSHQLYTDVGSIGGGLMTTGEINDQYMRFTAQGALTSLEKISADLEVAARSPEVSIELCPACWERDWNRSGEVDERDMRLLQMELDANGDYLPEHDPRRSPTFRFDLGDVYWGVAMLNFQRAFFHMLMAYRWSDVKLNAFFRGDLPTQITIHLDDQAQITKAKACLLAGLTASGKERQAYLAETDDDREFLPSPTQKNYAMPLPINAALYQTWADTLTDVERLINGTEGLDLAQAAQLGDEHWDNPPRGYLNIGLLFSAPKDITIDIKALDHAEDNPEAALKSFFGAAYSTQMRPSPITARLARMASEVEHGDESLERKLRYFLWVN